jgi:hypothetical protein
MHLRPLFLPEKKNYSSFNLKSANISTPKEDKMASDAPVPATNSKGEPSLFYPNDHQHEKLQKYESSCHCGAIQFTFLLPALDAIEVYDCNCTICDLKGTLNIYPFHEDVVWITTPEVREKSLGKYRWNSKLREHQFCKECGVSMCINFEDVKDSEESPHMAVNARTIKGVDWRTLNLMKFDGRNILPTVEEK